MSLTEALNSQLSLPVIAAPMFILSQPELVLAQCLNGIVGSFPAMNARPKELLDDWLAQLTETLAQARVAQPDVKIAPFAVNQIVHAANDRLEHDMILCVKGSLCFWCDLGRFRSPYPCGFPGGMLSQPA